MFSTNVFVLSYKNVGERDRRYSLLTKEFGLIQAIVRSVLRPNSKLAGHLEPPSFSWVELIETAKGFQLTQALEQNSFSNLRENSGAISLVLRLTKFLDDFLSLDSNSKVFSIWENFLAEVEKKVAENRDLDWQLLEAELVIGVLKELGFLPDISGCSLADGMSREFFSEYQKVIDGQLLFESQSGPAIKKIAFLFKQQAEAYMA